MATYDLYAITECNLIEAKCLIEQKLSTKLAEHDSLYHGIYYRLDLEEIEESFMIKTNVDPFDFLPVEENFPDYNILLYVTTSSSDRSNKIQNLLLKDNRIILLRHENL